MSKVKLRIDQEEIMVEQQTAEHYAKLMEDFKNLTAEKERVEAELAMIKAKLEDAGKDEKANPLPPEDKPGPVAESDKKMDGATFSKLVKERVKLEKLATTVLDSADVESMSDLDIKKKIILSKNKKMNLDGKSATYIDAAFDIAVAEINEKATVKAYPRGHVATDTKDVPDQHSARERMIERMVNPKGAK